MINGIHALMYAGDADKTRAFCRDVLRLPAVDAGHGWLIFGLPPAELGIHPTPGLPRHELYLMCDDIAATMADLEAKGAEFTSPVTEQGFGLVTSIAVPGGGELGLYEPRHRTAYDL